MFDPRIAEIRFGTGLSPRVTAPQSTDEMLMGLRDSDPMARRFPVEAYDDYRLRIVAYHSARKLQQRNEGTKKGEAAEKERRRHLRRARATYGKMFQNALLRRVHTATGMRERLLSFWADHFTAKGKTQVVKWASSPYAEDAIRPHLTGHFEDMLIAAVTHPLMLHYLDQHQSFGPNSQRGKRRGIGLNENLAREVLELHTLGVNGPYTQTDVRQLAELFAGLSIDTVSKFAFKRQFVEPGGETVLGKTYGKLGRLEDVHAVLRDLARHPATARHIAGKLARHFISDTPDPDLIAVLERAYLDSDGNLLTVYIALLDHPASWAPEFVNVKRPFDFMASALRALDIGETHLKRTEDKTLTTLLYAPLQVMGQPWENPNGPDGWPEDNAYWITPQFMAARMSWALAAPQALLKTLPDPRDFAVTALGSGLPADVAFAAGAAENRWEAIALVLTSPAFQKF